MNKLQLQIISFWVVGIITTLYCFAEFGAYIMTKSLTLLSDGFHNFSDVIGLLIAYWAVTAAKKESSDEYSYGWARAEILGGLINGSFLLSLCMYIGLEAIPKFIEPEAMDSAGNTFIYVASAGVAVNTFGTVLFAITGTHGHSHAGGGGHGHSHGGGGHGHSHSSSKKNDVELAVQAPKGHGHSHSAPDDHSHAHGQAHGHSHGHKDKHGHGHGEGHGHSHDHGHGHGHGEGHGHSHGAKQEFEEIEVSRYDMALQDHDSEPLLRQEDSRRQSVARDQHDDHGHSHAHSKKMCMDMNTYAVFIHYLGDMFSSVLVLIAGLLIKFFGNPDDKTKNWTAYVDPSFSLIIVALVLYTTLPLLYRCSAILMQSTPAEMNLALMKQQILQVPGVLGLHDFHVWQLVDELTISSVHVTVEEGTDFMTIASNIKEIYHHNGIHSTAVQPEFVPRHHRTLDVCEQNCVEDCEEDWCCKKTAEKVRLSIAEETSSSRTSNID